MNLVSVKLRDGTVFEGRVSLNTSEKFVTVHIEIHGSTFDVEFAIETVRRAIVEHRFLSA